MLTVPRILRRLPVAIIAVALTLTVCGRPAGARITLACLTGNAPEVAGDAAAIKLVREAVEAACVCASFDGSKGNGHRAYVACVRKAVAAEAAAGHLRTQCKRTVTTFYARSTCGTDPTLHKRPCIKTNSKTGKVTCLIKATTKKDGTTPTTFCTDRPGVYTQVACGAAHADWTNCIDATDSNGDLVVGAGPGGTDTGVCVCHPDFLDCNGQAADGCETDVEFDANHCGSCAIMCSAANATPACDSSTCGIGKCTAGHINLSGGGADGCETACPSRASIDVCNGIDDDCDGVIDNILGSAAGSACDLQHDVHHCGSAGNDCTAGNVHANWSCQSGSCTFGGCQSGYYDNGGPGDAVAGDHKCGYACTLTSSQEACNGLDDNCNGQIDEGVTAPSPAQVCGVSPAASRPECTSGVSVSCVNGGWQCTFPAGVCNPTCAQAAEVCDTLDNNCNGLLNENVPNYGLPCASDDGQPADNSPCRTTGTYVCNGANATQCNAVRNLAMAGPELCDGIDNDCDGLIDEPFSSKGSNSTYFVKPAVTKIAASLWIFSEEASRPTATTVTAGTGNGYTCNAGPCAGSAPTAPAGVTLDKTPACSVASRIPWFNVTPTEAEQSCTAMGGHVCTTTEWQTACKTNPPGVTTCAFGYAPNGVACTTALGPPYAVPFPTNGATFCNLQPTFDFDGATAGDQDGLLVTASSALKNCYADWTNLNGNTLTTGKLFDITGNLREITKAGVNLYDLMGGSYFTQVEAGATCSFSSFATDQNFASQDTGFRCCFSADPTL